jgi:DNA-binding NarL/FixJ family response regulator
VIMLIRVLVADDYVDARIGLDRIISDADDMELIGQAGAVFEVLKLAETSQPDVLLLDLAWPGDKNAGIKMIPKIKAMCPYTQIVAITAYTELLEPARKEGVFVLEKGYSIDELLTLIRWAYETRKVKAEEFAGAPSQPIPVLTSRELDVLKELAAGRTDKEISNTLHISEGTVNKHLTIIFQKLGVNNRTEAAIVALRKKLVSL